MVARGGALERVFTGDMRRVWRDGRGSRVMRLPNLGRYSLQRMLNITNFTAPREA